MDHNLGVATTHCCAECGGVAAGGVSLKACKSCKLVKYCNAKCQRNHWPKHKTICKRRAAELCDEALFKDPPSKEECPICFLPMPAKLICCITLPPAAILSVPIYDFVNNEATEELANKGTEQCYTCCGKSICGGCVHSFIQSGNIGTCPFCKADIIGKTDVEIVGEMLKRVETNNAGAIYVIGSYYNDGLQGLLQDGVKGMELITRAAELRSSQARYKLAHIYYEGGDMKKAKFHLEAAAMAGDEAARYNLGYVELHTGNVEKAVKHYKIAASAGHDYAMQCLLKLFEKGMVSRESIDSFLTAYNNSCSEMRSVARDAYIQFLIDRFVDES